MGGSLDFVRTAQSDFAGTPLRRFEEFSKASTKLSTYGVESFDNRGDKARNGEFPCRDVDW